VTLPGRRPADGLPARRRRSDLVGVVGALVLAAGVTAQVFSHGWLVRVDHRVAGWAFAVDFRDGDPVRALAVHAATLPGDRLGIGLVVAPFAVWLAWWRRSWQPVLRFAVALAVVAAVVWAAKSAVGRSAPGGVDMVHVGGRSYPSGHTIAAVVMAGLVSWLAADFALPPRCRAAVRVLGWLAPVTTATGMVLLTYHWLSDVLAGFAVGVVALRVIHLVFAGRLRDWGNAAWLGRAGPDGRGGAARPVGQRAG
jgi:membrane-associated phospholipid phosphatase